MDTTRPGAAVAKLKTFRVAYEKNMAAREKTSVAKEFLDSEVALDDCINDLGQLSGSVQLIEEFLQNDGLIDLASIVDSHPNPDVCQSAVNVVSELADSENFGERQDLAISFANTLIVELKWFRLLYNHLLKFDKFQDDEADHEAVASSLQCLSHSLSLSLPITVPAVLAQTELVRYIFERTRVFGEIALYAVDILADISSALLIDEEGDSVQHMVEKYLELGLDTIIEVLNQQCETKTFSSAEAKEVVLNLADSLSHCLVRSASTAPEGFEIAIKYYKHDSRDHLLLALKLLPLYLKRNPKHCDLFVSSNCLRHLFRYLRTYSGKDMKHLSELTSLIGIVESLITECSAEAFGRVVAKLVADSMANYRVLMSIFNELIEIVDQEESELLKDMATQDDGSFRRLERYDWLSTTCPPLKEMDTTTRAVEMALYDSSCNRLVPAAMIGRVVLKLVRAGDRKLKYAVHHYFDEKHDVYQNFQKIIRVVSHFEEEDRASAEELRQFVADHETVLKEAAALIDELTRASAIDEEAAAARERELRTERNRETRQKHKIRRMDAEMKRLQEMEEHRYARKKQQR